MQQFRMILARSLDGTIGLRDGKIPFRQREDMLFFKRMTTNHIIVMGNKTWKTFNNRPLPNRTTVVLTRDPHFARLEFQAATKDDKEYNVEFISSLDQNTDFSWARDDHRFNLEADGQQASRKDIFICGGAEIYKYAIENLPIANVHVTEIQTHYDQSENVRYTHDFEVDKRWKLSLESGIKEADDNNEFPYIFKHYLRREFL